MAVGFDFASLCQNRSGNRGIALAFGRVCRRQMPPPLAQQALEETEQPLGVDCGDGWKPFSITSDCRFRRLMPKFVTLPGTGSYSVGDNSHSHSTQLSERLAFGRLVRHEKRATLTVCRQIGHLTHLREMGDIRPSLTMLGVSRAFLSALLPALRGERHFALIENTHRRPRLASNLSGRTQSDPTISPITPVIMITTSNSLL